MNNGLDTSILTYRNGGSRPCRIILTFLVALDSDGDGVNERSGEAYDLAEFFTNLRAALYAFDKGILRRQEQVEVPGVFLPPVSRWQIWVEMGSKTW